jgi:hypothetical protein
MLYRQTRNQRRKLVKKVAVRRKIARKAPKAVIQRFVKQIGTLRDQMKKSSSPAQR